MNKFFARVRRWFWLSWQQLYHLNGNLWAAEFYDLQGNMCWLGIVEGKNIPESFGTENIYEFLKRCEAYHTFWGSEQWYKEVSECPK